MILMNCILEIDILRSFGLSYFAPTDFIVYEDVFDTNYVFVAFFQHCWFGTLLICDVSDKLIRNDEYLFFTPAF